jgi:hypothetical protein
MLFFIGPARDELFSKSVSIFFSFLRDTLTRINSGPTRCQLTGVVLQKKRDWEGIKQTPND